MTDYVQAAIETIYRKDDDLIIVGLTGRTGSGCSTVARILCSPKDEIRNSLFTGANPATNDERKQKIVSRHFEQTWKPFQLIQVRSIITLLLMEEDASIVKGYLREHLLGGKIDFETLDDHIDYMRAKIIELSLPGRMSDYINYVTNQLTVDCQVLRRLLGETGFVKLYQIVGKNLRLSGKPFDSSQRPGQFFTLAEKVNTIVKQIIKVNKDRRTSTLLVIDAIRSPLEAIFFQDRYATFYLAAVSCGDAERKQRLFKLGYSAIDVDAIDAEEYQSRDLDDATTFSVQDIQGCLQRADLYISNPEETHHVSRFTSLADQIIRFVSLMKHPGLVTPTAVERCMQLAYTAKLNSGCISRQVGAAVTDPSYSVQAVGWNDAPFGQVSCNLRNREDLLAGRDQAAYSAYERSEERYIEHMRLSTLKFIPIKGSGRNLSYCFKTEYNRLTGVSNQVHTRSLHAEENAFLQITKSGGRGIKGGFLFTTASPCELCAKKAYQLGIAKIFYIDPYPGIAISHIINGGSSNPEMILFSGAIGRAFHRLYTPILAYKDEMNALATRTTTPSPSLVETPPKPKLELADSSAITSALSKIVSSTTN
jgi:deoxycytidylate deaminase